MITNLPANVTAETTYIVTFEGWADANVTGDTLNGLVTVEQAGASHTFPVEELPGLIAALQAAAAGLDVPTAPTRPAYVIDGDGDRHELASDGTYRLILRDGTRGYIRRTLEYIRAEFGIREEG